jgi:hypothetical protein
MLPINLCFALSAARAAIKRGRRRMREKPLAKAQFFV